ncbi:MAG: phage tail tape measure protein [Clostridia bacterium]|nr:phage tail tape measure protein [Clostridia bacterium]
MAFDGSVKFDTKLDETGLKNGLDKASKTAKLAAGAITTAIGAGTAAAIKVGSDFEKAMSSVYAISNATGETAEKLKNAADEAGATTQFSATQAANALEYLALAGYNAEESMAALPKVLNLAAAGGLDLAYASDLLTDSMAVMGLGIDDMDNFSDQLAMTASKANTSVAQLGEAVLIAGGQAKLCGMSVDEMNTALGILADKGIKGSEGGTALRNVLKNLYTPTSKAADELERLGIVTSEDGKLRNVQDVLIDLNAALSSLSESDKVEAVGNIFDTRTIAAATNLLDDCNERWDELNGYLNDCDGSADKMAKTLTDNLWGRLEEVSSAAESCGIAFYDAISEHLKVAAEEGANQLQSLAVEMKEGELKEGIEALGAGLGALITNVIELARVALPPLLTSIGWLCENIGIIGPLVLASIAAIKGYKILQMVTTWYNGTMVAVRAYSAAVAANSAMEVRGITISGLLASTLKAKEVLLALLTGKMSIHTAVTALATKEQMAFNAAMNANMAGVIFASVVALTGVVVALTAAMNKETAEERALRKERERLSAATNELKGKQEDLKKSLEDTLTAQLGEAKAAEELVDGIEDLMKVEGLSAASKEIMADRVEKLNKLLPDLNLQYDKEKNVLKDANGEILTNTDLIRENIKAMLERAKAEAYYDNYVESLKNAANAEKTLQEAKESLAKAQDDYNKAAAEAEENAKNKTGIMAGVAIIDPKVTAALKEAQETCALAEENLYKIYADSKYWKEMYEKGVISGSEYPNGVVAGVDSKLSEVDAAGVRVGAALDGGYRRKTGTQSPAKEGIENGEFWDEGIVIGVENGLEDVEKAGESVGESLIDSFKNEAGGFRDELNDILSGKGVPKENNEKQTEAYDERIDVLEKRLEMEFITEKEYLEEKEKLRDKYLTKGTKEWLDATQELYEGWLEIEENAIEKEISLLEYRYNTGIITEEAYYKELKRIRDTYFADNEEEWRKYTEKIVDYERDKADDIVDVIEDTTDKIKDAYEDAFDDVNDSIDDMADGLKNAGDFYVTGTVEINGKDVEYSSLIDMDKRAKWYEDLYTRAAGVKDRLKNSGFTDEEVDSFWEHFRNMGEEGMYEYGNLLLNSSDADFVKQVKGYLEGEAWGQKTADLIYADDKLDAEKTFAEDVANILVEAGKELSEEFYTLGDLSGEEFSEAFLENVRNAMNEAMNEIQALTANFETAEGASTFSTVYNFYSSGQTVGEQLMDADRHAAIERGRNG